MDSRLTVFPLVAALIFAAASSCAESDPRAADTVTPANPGTRGVSIVFEDESGASSPLYGESHALLIGVSAYSNGWPRLESIPAEIDTVEAALQTQGFSVTKIIDPDAVTLKQSFEDFVGARGYLPDARLLVYFAGHGHTRKDGAKAYLVPADAPLPDRDEGEFLIKAVPMSRVVQWAREMEAKHVLFLFDSCFSGTIFKSRDVPKVPRHISHAASLSVRQFITAGSADQPVPAASVFTPAFVDALSYGWADMNGDGYTTGAELGVYLQGKVPLHSAQIPQYGKISDYTLSRGDFVFAAGNSAAVRPIPHRVPEVAVLPGSAASGDGPRVDETPSNIAAGPASLPNPPGGSNPPPNPVDGSTGPANLPALANPAAQLDVPEMIRIEPGAFIMGDNGGGMDNRPAHRVTIAYPFAMSKYEITQGQFAEYARSVGVAPAAEAKNYPVVGIAYDTAIDYARWLSSATGRRFRLPTEAEWEYAARGGTTTRYWWGDSVSRSSDMANCSGCSHQSTSGPTVGQDYPANAFGLHDVIGNVNEWVLDCLDGNRGYQTAPIDGQAHAGRCTARVVRGGSWKTMSHGAQVYQRHKRWLDGSASDVADVGIRLVEELE